ncbi:transposase [Paraburkholderia caribensis]|uniref:transposase n=1 Tax=Paraburkholderia caribensis TaxID=75105 RepID=UPI0034D17345
MQFEELSNEEWSLVGPMLNGKPLAGIQRRGRPRAQTRVVANAVLWLLTTGEAWSKLPTRYPSLPTCRCRFDEWRQDGKLKRMIEMLSNTGRHFQYMPERSQVVKEPGIKHNVRPLDPSGLPHVIWRSQESWQSHSKDVICHVSPVTFLDGAQQPPDTRSLLPVAFNDARVPEHLIAADRFAYEQRVFWMGLSAKGSRVVDKRGYVIYLASDAVPGEMFRGWAEIMRDGKRVARSGLVGPRFAAAEAAKQCAMDWAHRWIEHVTRWECNPYGEAALRTG